MPQNGFDSDPDDDTAHHTLSLAWLGTTMIFAPTHTSTSARGSNKFSSVHKYVLPPRVGLPANINALVPSFVRFARTLYSSTSRNSYFYTFKVVTVGQQAQWTTLADCASATGMMRDVHVCHDRGWQDPVCGVVKHWDCCANSAAKRETGVRTLPPWRFVRGVVPQGVKQVCTPRSRHTEGQPSCLETDVPSSP